MGFGSKNTLKIAAYGKKEQFFSDSISMCETVIDEHFRRSLGNNYVALLTNEKANKLMKVEIPSPTPSTTSTASNSQASLSPAATTPPVRSAPHTPIPSSSPVPTFMPLAPVAVTIQPAEVAIPDADNFVTVQASTPPVAAFVPESVRPASSASNVDIDVDGDVEDENSDGENDENGVSVDDHFAKALGNDMWKKIQEKSLKS
jgi:Transcription cofactor vestigial-like protein 4